MRYWSLEPLDPSRLSAHAADAWHRTILRAQDEAQPSDPHPSLRQTIDSLTQTPAFVQVRHVVTWDPSREEILGRASAAVWDIGSNEHIAMNRLWVDPRVRRQCLGLALVGWAAEACRDWGRRLMVMDTSNRVPSGEAFARNLGGTSCLDTRINEVVISEISAELITDWLGRRAEVDPRYQIGWWDQAYPAADLDRVGRMKDLVNDAPHGELDFEPIRHTPEMLRELDQRLAARGVQRWTLYAECREDGEIAGYTETSWHPDRPTLLYQEDTAVAPSHRNRGLGRILKAEMLARVLRERPTVTRVRTGNATQNGPMLKINHELGFREAYRVTTWQFEVSRILEITGDARASSEFQR